MDLEDSISSWIGKIREGFDTFCSEAKDILPKHVQNVQEKLIRAAENLKQLHCDLNIFSTCMLDYSENGKGPESDEMEENKPCDENHHPPLMESFEFSDDDIHLEELSDSKPEAQSLHYLDLLGDELLRGEVIRDGFPSPLSDSIFDHETRYELLDAMTFLDSDSECWSNFAQSPISNIAESNAKIMDWERLDEDWEIV